MTGPALAALVVASWVAIWVVLLWLDVRDERDSADLADQLTRQDRQS